MAASRLLCGITIGLSGCYIILSNLLAHTTNYNAVGWSNKDVVTGNCGGTNTDLPRTWPCQWNKGLIPFAFDFFALSPRRLTSVVYKAHSYIEERSCLKFNEVDPVDAADKKHYTYLFYTYSEVLESCCFKYFTKTVGRRLVLITPTCFLPVEVGHATLHALGLDHPKNEPFSDLGARAVMIPYKCQDIEEKLANLGENL